MDGSLRPVTQLLLESVDRKAVMSSVLNFNRVPHLMCVAAALLFAAPVDHFFDDYLTMDLKVGRGSAQECLDALHNAVRLRLEPKKRKRRAGVQEELKLYLLTYLRRSSAWSAICARWLPPRCAARVGCRSAARDGCEVGGAARR